MKNMSKKREVFAFNRGIDDVNEYLNNVSVSQIFIYHSIIFNFSALEILEVTRISILKSKKFIHIYYQEYIDERHLSRLSKCT